jgi:hypothetical protein
MAAARICVGSAMCTTCLHGGLWEWYSAERRANSTHAVSIDLNHPVPGSGGRPLGIIVANHDLKFPAQWYADAFMTHTVVEIPIGTTVEAQQLVIGLHIGGAYHVLQAGPQSYGHCVADGTAIHGTGTSTATIFRETEGRWVRSDASSRDGSRRPSAAARAG